MTRILVFPSCNEPGLEIVRSLIDQSDIEVHGGSCHEPAEDLSAYLLQRFVRLPLLGEPGFREQLESYIRQRGIHLVFPTLEKLVSAFSQWSIPGVQFVVPSAEVAAIAESKLKTYQALSGIVPLPELYPGGVPAFPVYGKPPAGSGGRGARLIGNERELQAARQDGLLISEYLPGEEMVAYGLGDPRGRLLGCITKKMGQWRGGSSHTGAIHDDPVVRRHAVAIAGRLRLPGPWFAQFRQDRHGTYRLMEVNARVGGGSGICRLAGVNFPLLAVRAFTGEPITVPTPIASVRWVRSLHPAARMEAFDRVVWDLRALFRSGDGQLRPQVVAALFALANRNVLQDCYGPAVPDGVSRWQLQAHFRDRYQTARSALAALGDPGGAVFITDDLADRQMLGQAAPKLRIVAPESVEVLGVQRL